MKTKGNKIGLYNLKYQYSCVTRVSLERTFQKEPYIGDP